MDKSKFYNSFVGKLCYAQDKPHMIFMIYDMFYKKDHRGSMFPAYKYISMNTGSTVEAPCRHFHDGADYIKWLTPKT